MSDQRHLDQLERKFQLIRDYVTGVITGRATGFYLFGPGGCGKSYCVVKELERQQVPFKHFNSRMTGRGLFNALQDFPDAIHLLEDGEGLFCDTGAKGVLRSAFWSQGPRNQAGRLERTVTWTTHLMEHSVVFTGGIIMTANRAFPEQPELEAVKTRIGYLQLCVPDNEMMALMRAAAIGGFRAGPDVMDPTESLEVAEFVILQCLGLRRLLDMRLYVNSCSDYLQWRECQAGCSWHDIVAARVRQRPTTLGEVLTIQGRAAQKQRELEIAAEIAAEDSDREERLRVWREKTGKSEQTLYRRLAELDERRQRDSQ